MPISSSTLRIFLPALFASAAALAAACSPGSDPNSGINPGSGGSGGDGDVILGSGGGGPCLSGENEDRDGDGWTVAQGDCDDCNAAINPGAVELPGSTDHDCDGIAGNTADPCDESLQLAISDPRDAARAIELCQFIDNPATDQRWGVLSAQWVRANGNPMANPGLQVGTHTAFGPNVTAQGGSRLLSLSSGRARSYEDGDRCQDVSCEFTSGGAPPPGFPQSVPNCEGTTEINDDVALEVRLRAPTNATGFTFDFKFHSFEYSEYVCSEFNDQFIALVTPPPPGANNGNISFDANGNPVSVNIGFFTSCHTSSCSSARFAEYCNFMSAFDGRVCPPPPTNCCPDGPNALAGTGFGQGEIGDTNGHGATAWLRTTSPVPVDGGEEFTLRFAIWDAGDQALDSTVNIDNFRWVIGEGAVVGTNPPN